MKFKRCIKCDSYKPLEEFTKDKHKKDGHRNYCRKCDNASYRKYYKRNRDKLLARKKKWRKDHPECYMAHHYEKNYNITLKDYDKMFEEQQGCCFICGRHQSEFNRRLDVDHDHSTSRVRGLLCYSCNTKLGWYEKQQEKLLIYLERDYDVKRAE